MDQLRAHTFLYFPLGNSSEQTSEGHSCGCGGSSRYRGGVELTGDLETLAGLAQRPGDPPQTGT
jgi:hypothetical protein